MTDIFIMDPIQPLLFPHVPHIHIYFITSAGQWYVGACIYYAQSSGCLRQRATWRKAKKNIWRRKRFQEPIFAAHTKLGKKEIVTDQLGSSRILLPTNCTPHTRSAEDFAARH